MLQMSLSANNALRAMLHIARQGGRVVVREEIIQTLDVPPKAFGNIMKTLVICRLLRSFRGTGGGFALTRPADKITLREVVEAIEGKISVNSCLRDEAGCRQLATCSVHTVWQRVQQRIVDRLDTITLAQLLDCPVPETCRPN